jgi:hypothetical protein
MLYDEYSNMSLVMFVQGKEASCFGCSYFLFLMFLNLLRSEMGSENLMANDLSGRRRGSHGLARARTHFNVAG